MTPPSLLKITRNLIFLVVFMFKYKSIQVRRKKKKGSLETKV